MPELADLNEVIDAILNAFRAVGAELTWGWFWYQIGLLLAAAGVARILAAILRARVDITSSAMGLPGAVRRFVRALFGSLPVAFFVLLAASMRASMLLMTWPSRSYVLAVATSLATAWLVIRLMAGIVRDQLLVRIIAVVAFLVAALSILGLLDQVTAALDSIAITVGGLRLTPLLILKVAVLLSFAIWLASLISKFIDTWLTRSGDLTPSAQVLISKLASIALIVLAVVIVLSSVGIDLSALTIFGGAIGVGLGFGLQKIVANFISGIILLADKSVKPGDLVTIGDNFGRVSTMNIRYITVAAGDGREFLIPNEDLVTQKVVNWTYRDRNTLVEVKFGTDYDADPKVVCKLACDIAASTSRVVDVKPPLCLLTEFADYGMRYSLTFWISDPEAGMGNVRSDVMIALWDAFRREGIRVPYPVRDIRVRSALPIEAIADAADRD
jgi:small-conductance mechanosensitive channel